MTIRVTYRLDKGAPIGSLWQGSTCEVILWKSAELCLVTQVSVLLIAGPVPHFVLNKLKMAEKEST
jgi:hypothetical protein